MRFYLAGLFLQPWQRRLSKLDAIANKLEKEREELADQIKRLKEQTAHLREEGEQKPQWRIVRQRTLEAVKEAQLEWDPIKPQHADIAAIIDAAIDLEATLYASRGYGDVLFRLRKALEGVFGHEYGEEEENGEQERTTLGTPHADCPTDHH